MDRETRRGLWLLALLLGVSALLFFAFYPRLPDPIATHFGRGGEADGWTGRAGFVWLWSATLAFMVAVMHGGSLLLPRLPVAMINLPHRELWLEEPNREATLAHLRGSMLGLGNLTLGLMVYLQYEILATNAAPGEPRLGSSFFWVLGLYLALLGVWVVRLLSRYRTPPPRSD